MPPQPRFDRQQLVQAALSRGGGGAGGANLVQAVQAFMEAMGRSMNQFVRTAGQAQQAQAEQTQAAVAQVADAAQRAVNQAEQRKETRRQEERQAAMTEEGRRFQLEATDYERALTSNVQREGAELASIIQENEAKKQRLLDEQERGAATIAESVGSVTDWIYDMDAANAWNRLGKPDNPNYGWEVRQQMLDLARMATVVREDMLDSPYADKLHAMVAQANQALIRGEREYMEPIGAFEQPMMPVPTAMLDALKQRGLRVNDQDAIQGLAGVKLSGRMEMVCSDPRILVDGAHNAASMEALMRAIGQHIPYDSMVVIFGCNRDKDVDGMLQRIQYGADKVIFTRNPSPRSADPEELAGRFVERTGKMAQVADELASALEIARRAVTREDLICITGSFYLVGLAKQLLDGASG